MELKFDDKKNFFAQKVARLWLHQSHRFRRPLQQKIMEITGEITKYKWSGFGALSMKWET